MAQLSTIVERLEAGDLSLAESLQQFEEGVRLSQLTQKQLNHAESKVRELLALRQDGSADVRDFEAEDDDDEDEGEEE